MSGRTIGGLASEAGVSVETIRYYQRKGLLPEPEPLRGQWRHYGQQALMLVRFIKLMQGFGFTLRDIKELLSHFPDVEGFCQSATGATASKISQLEKEIGRLKRVRDALT